MSEFLMSHILEEFERAIDGEITAKQGARYIEESVVSLEKHGEALNMIVKLQKQLSECRALVNYAFFEGQDIFFWEDSAAKKALEKI